MTEIKPGTPLYLAGYIEQLGVPETLEQAIAERDAWVESAAQFSRNEDYYRGLVERIGQAIGPQAYIAGDGSRSQDVLCAKVPELVVSLLNGLREAREALVTFAACTEQIADDESGQEWAKFRLLVKDYRRAARTLAHLDTLLAQEGES